MSAHYCPPRPRRGLLDRPRPRSSATPPISPDRVRCRSLPDPPLGRSGSLHEGLRAPAFAVAIGDHGRGQQDRSRFLSAALMRSVAPPTTKRVAGRPGTHPQRQDRPAALEPVSSHRFSPAYEALAATANAASPSTSTCPSAAIEADEEGEVLSVGFKGPARLRIKLIEEFMVTGEGGCRRRRDADRQAPAAALPRCHEETLPRNSTPCARPPPRLGLHAGQGRCCHTRPASTAFSRRPRDEFDELINMSTLTLDAAGLYNPENFGHFGLALKSYRISPRRSGAIRT